MVSRTPIVIPIVRASVIHNPGVIEITKKTGIKKYSNVKSKSMTLFNRFKLWGKQKKRGATNSPEGLYRAPQSRLYSVQTPRKALELRLSDRLILIK